MALLPPRALDLSRIPAEAGGDSDLSAYFLCANRNKRSIAIDLATPAGAFGAAA